MWGLRCLLVLLFALKSNLPSFVFINISGWTFIFEGGRQKRSVGSQESGVRSQEARVRGQKVGVGWRGGVAGLRRF